MNKRYPKHRYLDFAHEYVRYLCISNKVLFLHMHRYRTYSTENTQAPVKKNYALTLNASFDEEHGFRYIGNGPHAKD